ncbi:energy transducer TonB [Pseudoxanthomonas wuyuanensis]|uniref:Outer membrane transport energization protein TonB n=1 Tax=Pseudoxanthomonas wuyuanensis TaxID=1073196 RepID=A0A286D715_9GAMM|nr:energy transducer TonB [Pseudoxanthomonas wuyuanensis]KAF1721136.1 energy transducer TonB [Pseudoxanthomonas wuyuanensis]SOD54420.1 outer membrane transport energization protein TonB [Pseudoxanthomonas wuyuanensis]
MVRALPFRSSSRPDFARILAIATAIAVHVLAMMLLLMPLAGPQPERITAPSKIPPWVIPVEPVKPPDPPELVQPKKPLPPQPVVIQRVQPKETPQPPVIVDQGHVRAIDIPAVQSEGPVGDDAVPDVSPMLMGAQLRYAKAPSPPYPIDALRVGAQGTVMLKILVDTDGTPVEVSIETSSGNKSLDRQARQHVLKHWRFEPAVRDGRPVQAYGLVPIAFTLQ